MTMDRELEVGVVGSGSNLLIAGAGVRAFVLKLSPQLSQIIMRGTRSDCGGGVRLPAGFAPAPPTGFAQLARTGLTGTGFADGPLPVPADWMRS